MTRRDWIFHVVSRRRLIQGALVAPFVAIDRSMCAYAAESYAWRNVQIGGGGYVTGIVAHPREKGLVYIRTDVGGIYRWNGEVDDAGQQWTPLTDGFAAAQWNYYGVESIALDPTDPNLIYAALGMFPWAGKGRVFMSRNRGVDWEPLALEVTMHGNGPLRTGGERLLVHPSDPHMIFFGSRNDGLWRSTDGGANWQQVLPEKTGDKGVGITFISVDALTGGEGAMYAGIAGKGVFRSRDVGVSWSEIGGPKVPVRAATVPNHALVVTSPTGVFRLDSAGWTDITPDSANEYSAVSADLHNSDLIVVAAITAGKRKTSLPIFVSSTGGRDWVEYAPQTSRVISRPSVPWWPRKYFASAVAATLLDPHTSGRLWFTDWYGVWRTDDLFKDEQIWRSPTRGLEEMVVMTLATPPIGAPLLSGVADNDGFLHLDLNEFPADKFQGIKIWNTLGIDYHEANPCRVVRVGIGRNAPADSGSVGVSDDGGQTWHPIPWPFGAVSKVAYSATDPNVIVALPFNHGPKATNDLGISWHGPDNLLKSPPIKKMWQWGHHLAADRVDGEAFYLFAAGEFFHTLDGGKSWSRTAMLPDASTPMVEAAPGREGVVWLGLEDHGLYSSPDKGATFTKIEGVDSARLFSFGKAPPGRDNPSVFLYGRLTGSDREAIYRSDEMGVNWHRISVPKQPVGNQPHIMRGDRQIFGRVFVGTGGRGILLGEIQASK